MNDDVLEINTCIDKIEEYYNYYTKKIVFIGKYNDKACKFTYEIKLKKFEKNDRMFQIEKNDIVFGFVVEVSENEFIFLQQPLIILNNSKTHISNFIRWNLKSTRSYVNKYEFFNDLSINKRIVQIKQINKLKKENPEEYEKLKKEYNDTNDEKIVVDYINERVVDYIKNGNENALKIYEQLDVERRNLESFYNEWYEKRIIRQIYLLGITNDEFRGLNMCPLIFYNHLFKSPWYLYSLTESKVENIQNITLNGNKPTWNELSCARIARKLYKLTKSSTCAPINNVTRSYNDFKNELKEKWGISKKIIKNRKGESIVYLYFDYCYEFESYVANYIDKLIVKTARNFKDPLTADDEYNKSLEEPINKKKLRFNKHKNYIYNIDFTGTNLVEEQKLAVKLCVNSQIIILTGGGGTGKSTTCKMIYKALVDNGKTVIGTAFSSIAATNLSTILPEECLCENMDYLIQIKKMVKPFDVCFFDEGSMITIECLYRFIKAFDFPFQMIIVGDLNQIEPIGQGKLMSQLVKSKRVPIFKLVENHRILKSIEIRKKAKEDGITLDIKDQNNESIILNNANYLVDGMRDKTKPMIFKCGDGFSVIEGDVSTLKLCIEGLYEAGIEENEITIIYPYNDILKELNMIPQEYYRKNNKFRVYNNQKFMVGDRIKYLHNKKNLKLSNGTFGIIDDITDKGCYVIMNNTKFLLLWNKKQLEIDDDPEKQLYMSEITQAFAGTVNANQGLSRNYVFVFMPTRYDSNGEKTTMVNINSLYTSITRAVIGLMIIGDKDIIQMATAKISPPTFENLANLLREKRNDFEDIMNYYTDPPYKCEIVNDEEDEDNNDDYDDDCFSD